MGVVCKQPTTTCGKSNNLTSKCANVGSSGEFWNSSNTTKKLQKQIKIENGIPHQYHHHHQRKFVVSLNDFSVNISNFVVKWTKKVN